MKKLVRLLVGVMISAFTSQTWAKGILGSVWIGEPKTYVNGKLICSPDPEDNPERRPHEPVKGYPELVPYLYIKKVGANGFRILEDDNCGGLFGFDGDHSSRRYTHSYPQFFTEGFFFYYRGNRVFSRLGEEVGTITENRIEITEGGAKNTDFEYILIEIKPDGNLSFYSDFRIHGYVTPEHPHGSRFEHAAIYSAHYPKK